MATFLILFPFATFAVAVMVAPPHIALFVGAALSTAVIVADICRGRSLKILQAGAAVLFAALGGYIVLIDSHLSSGAARGLLDAGLLAVVLASLAAGVPFTLQYGREKVDAATAARPEFLRANYVLSWVWVAALATMLAADLCAIYVTLLPVWTGIAAAFLARNGAMAFTQWYVARRRADGERAHKAALAQGKPA